MMAVAVLATIVVIALLGGSVDLDGIDRDVVVTGASEADVPGEVGFKVIEDIGDPDATMNVGVVVDPLTGAVHNATRCRITDSEGDPVDLREGMGSDTYTSEREGESDRPLVVAERLRPGEYRAVCGFSDDPVGGDGEPGVERTEVTFGVARVLTTDEVFALAKPVFGIVAAVVVGGFVGLVGLILMIVGLVIGNRSGR